MRFKACPECSHMTMHWNPFGSQVQCQKCPGRICNHRGEHINSTSPKRREPTQKKSVFNSPERYVASMEAKRRMDDIVDKYGLNPKVKTMIIQFRKFKGGRSGDFSASRQRIRLDWFEYRHYGWEGKNYSDQTLMDTLKHECIHAHLYISNRPKGHTIEFFELAEKIIGPKEIEHLEKTLGRQGKFLAELLRIKALPEETNDSPQNPTA